MPLTALDGILGDLNESQLQAVVADTDHPILVLAGPGAGKTRTLVHRIAYIIDYLGFPADSILAVTFSRAAAAEMRRRLHLLLGPRARDLRASTIHSYCYDLMHRRGVDSKPIEYDAQKRFVTDYIKTALIAQPKLRDVLNPTQWRWALSWIDAAKDELIPPAHSLKWFADHIQTNLRSVPEMARGVAAVEAPLLTDLYTKYQTHMHAEGLVDFSDMLVYALGTFRTEPAVLAQEQEWYRYVCVDELQDTSAIQYQILSLVAKHTHLFVVADEMQAVYAFRNADPNHNVLAFLKRHPQGEIIKLECNYRSTRTIVNVANRLLAAAPYEDDRYRKVLQPRPDAQEGLQVEVSYHRDDQEEADSVADKIEALIGATGYLPQDIFVLYRTNAQSAPIERALSARDIPHVLMAGLGFWERSATKDMMAYLRLYNKRFDNSAFERVCNYASIHMSTSGTRYLGRKFVEACKQLNPDSYWDATVSMAQNPPEKSWRPGIHDFIRMMAGAPKSDSLGWSLPELVLYFTKQYDHHRQMEDTTDSTGWLTGSAIASLSRRFPSLPRLIAYSVKESKKTKSEAESYKSVVLGTIHSAKGLERKVVFGIGITDSLLPHYLSRNLYSPWLPPPVLLSISDERRVCFVLISRAAERLYLSCPMSNGWKPNMRPSRFLEEMGLLDIAQVPEAYRGAVERARSEKWADEPPDKAGHRTLSEGSQ